VTADLLNDKIVWMSDLAKFVGASQARLLAVPQDVAMVPMIPSCVR